MNTIHLRLPLLFILLLSVHPARTQEAPDIDVRFRCLGWRIPPGHPFEFFSKGEWVSIDDLNTFHRSLEPYHYTGPNPVIFYRKNQRGERVSVLEVDLSGNYRLPMLLFAQVRQTGQADPRYYAVVFEDHPSRFPPGSFLLVNSTTMSLQGRIGDSTFQLNPGQRLNVKPELPPEQRAVHFLLATPDESGELRVLQSTYMQYDADTKHLTFVLPHPNGRGNVNTFTITEQVLPSE